MIAPSSIKVGDIVQFTQYVKGQIYIQHVVLILSGAESNLTDPWTFTYKAFYIQSTSLFHRGSVHPFRHNTSLDSDYTLLYQLEP
jgi:hypothetical protein